MVSRDADALEKMKLLEERIRAPSIWGRVPCGIRFEDLQDTRYDDAVRLLKNHYLTEEGEILYRSLKIIEDKEGTDEFVHNVRIWMKDKMSIAAVKEGTDKLVGVLIMRIQEKSAFSRTFSRVKLTYNPLYTTVMTFFNTIEKPVNIFEQMNCRRYFKIYIIALKKRYRHRALAKEMVKAAIGLAASANVAVMAGIFTTARLQTIAEDLGFVKLNEIYYIRYLIDGQIVFHDTGVGNYGAALMAFNNPDVEEPAELVTHLSSRFTVDIKLNDDHKSEDTKAADADETSEKKTVDT